MRKINHFTYLVFLTFIAIQPLKAQEIAIGQWREHLSYQKTFCITEGNNKIYCSSKSGLFSINKSDNSLERLSKVVGLSDVGVNSMNFDTYNNTLVIAYKNANLDI